MIMKGYILAAIFMLTYTLTHAQSFSVGSFRSVPLDFSASEVDMRRQSPYGEPCALVKISTKLTGLSFDAGAECVSDVVYADPGVWLYLPSGTRTITIARSRVESLVGWHFPVTLESGRTYEMTLKMERPKPPRSEKPARIPFGTDQFSSHFLQSHIGMELFGGVVEEGTLGISYSFMPGRMGLYTSIDWSSSCGVSFFAGAAFRLLDSKDSNTDWQLYVAPGISTCGTFSMDAGTRFAWKSDKALSRLDFSLGCQYWGGNTFVPYVGLGSKISAYAAVGVLGLLLCAVGLAL